jgi:pyruvate/2-oxoglutarate/acetoin dehydrogenase E1 component
MPESANTYFDELARAMGLLASDPRTVFVGQAVKYAGQAAFDTFSDVPMDRRVEMPVVEDFQMGFCTGLSLEGFIPVCFYPRWDFLIIAANQLVNHLDKLPSMGWKPKVIIRTAVGRSKPLDPGPQHTQNYSHAIRNMLDSVRVVELFRSEQIVPTYQRALEHPGSSIIVEYMEKY